MNRPRRPTAILIPSLLLLAATCVAQATPEAADPAQPAAQEHAAEHEGQAEPAEPHAVIPPGQEDLLADILGRGATLPNGCSLANGQVEFNTVKATYTCPTGEVIFVLAHPSQATSASTQTERFAITLLAGAPPDGFAAALASRVRAKESAFEWKWVGTPAKRSSTIYLATAGLLAIAVLAWALRSRAAARRAKL